MVNNYDVCGLDTHKLGGWVVSSEYCDTVGSRPRDMVLVTWAHAVTYCHDTEVIIAIITLQERGSAVESEEE